MQQSQIAILHPKEYKYPDSEITQRIMEATLFLDECIKIIEDKEVGNSNKIFINAMISQYEIEEIIQIPNLKSKDIVLNFRDKLSKLLKDSYQEITFQKKEN